MVVDDRDDAVFTSLGNSTGFRRVIVTVPRAVWNFELSLRG